MSYVMGIRHLGGRAVFRRTALAFLTAIPLTFAGAAFAQQHGTPLSIDAGPLPSSLQDFQRQTGVELLFDPSLVGAYQAPRIRGAYTTENALRLLLADSNLTVRRAQSGAWIVERLQTAPLEQQDAAAPEIIVIGRRTNNADIRRFESDVQAYTIVTQEEIRSAHRDNLDQYFASRVTSNTTAIPSDASSAIDLRGFGTGDTLVLVDGRRMPSSPFPTDFNQANLNALPLHAVDRVEVLTGAAGGIYGFGALGGVVNVVIDREHRGFDLYVTEGISSRGDGRQERIEGSYGYSSEDGATDFTVFAGYAESDSLLSGQRDFDMRDRRMTYAISPDAYLSPFIAPTNHPNGRAITVISGFGDPLVLKPEYGGAALGSTYTYLPADFSGGAEDLAAALAEHAGQVDFNLPEADLNVDLGASPSTDALLVNLRRRFDGFEIFADAAILRSRGEVRDPREHGDALIGPDSPVNPFTDYIDVYFPVEGNGGSRTSYRLQTTRYSLGALIDLPSDWRGAAEANWGGMHARVDTEIRYSNAALFLLLLGDPDDLNFNPFGGWDAFQAALAQDVTVRHLSREHDTTFEHQSLRLAGPLFATSAGHATLTLLAEHRAEEEAPWAELEITDDGSGPVAFASHFGELTTDITSLHAELRAPIFNDVAPHPLLRGLEWQLAVRRDERENTYPRELLVFPSEPAEVSYSETAYTAGFKVSPASWLTLRTSFATGEQPPSTLFLRTSDDIVFDFPFAEDARRPGAFLGDVPVTISSGGSPDLEPARAESLSLGVIFTPFGEDGPRFSIDYSNIRRTGDITGLSFFDIVAREDELPGRVIRGPLTADDMALGYTVGPVIAIDARLMNGAALDMEAIDLRAEWPLVVLDGRLRLYGDATYHMHNSILDPFQSNAERTDYLHGPLRWRANAGFDWTRGDLTLGANVQYFGAYPTLEQGGFGFDDDSAAISQGSDEISSQTFVDVYVSWRLPNHDVTLDFGVVNLLDAAPLRETAFHGISRDDPGYSRYGDPRQRRFELTLHAHF